MPRKRMLWPAFFGSDQLAHLPLAACRTYEGFWCFADDRGRMLDDPAQLWADVWIKRRSIDHVSIDDVETHLELLTENGQLCRYEVGGGAFRHVIAWDEHQKINHPTTSKLPPCPHHQGREWASWWRADDTATDRWRQAEKRSKKGDSVSHSRSHSRSGSGAGHATPENEPNIAATCTDGLSEDYVSDSLSSSTPTPSQFSSVQVSSVKGGGNVREFKRPSQNGGIA